MPDSNKDPSGQPAGGLSDPLRPAEEPGQIGAVAGLYRSGNGGSGKGGGPAGAPN